MCAASLVGRVPELAEHFEPRINGLILDKNHAVILGGLALFERLCVVMPSLVSRSKRSLLTSLIARLQQLCSSTYAADYDIGGLCDPFLQIKILRVLRLLGKDDVQASEQMTDVLTHIVTNTQSTKNVGQAVLYETLRTIMDIRADDALWTMCINTLGKLLGTHSDNNVRYVALTLLNRVMTERPNDVAVQKHRLTILECLRDPDISIRRRAVDLALCLVNRSTIELIASELISAILVGDGYDQEQNELRVLVISKLAVLAAQHARQPRWYVGTVIQLLQLIVLPFPAKEELVASFVRIISNTQELHEYAVIELYSACKDVEDVGGLEALIQAATWCLGEFGHLLVGSLDVEHGALVELLGSWAQKEKGLSPSAISYIITALGKLSVRTDSVDASRKALQSIAGVYASNAGLAHRAHETWALVGSETLRSLVFQPMPATSGAHKLAEPAEDRPSPGTPMVAPVLDIFAELAQLSLDPATSSILVSKSPSPKPVVVVVEEVGSRVFEKHGLAMDLVLVGRGAVKATFVNKTTAAITEVVMRCAVPKSLRIELKVPSDTTIQPNQSIRQEMVLTDVASGEPVDKDRIKLRVKLSFCPPLSSTAVTEVFECQV